MFLGGFAFANVGAFVSFLPLFQILLPLKAVEIAPHAAEQLMAAIAAIGAAVAGGANLAAGWLSDRSGSRYGRRRPWILGGAVGVVASYGLIWRAGSPLGLLLAFVAFQIAFNALFAPLLALIPDRVPASARGWASALAALGHPLGTALGALAIGTLVVGEGDRYLALAAIVLVTTVPFALGLSADPPRSPVTRAATTPIWSRRYLSREFVLGWAARSCVTTAFSIVQLFLLFYVQSLLRAEPAHAAERGVALLGVIFGVTTAVASLVFGCVSDAVGRRKPFVVGGALTVGAAMLALAAAPSWPVAVAAYGLFAVGAGSHAAVDFALMVGLLPSHDHAARDLGLLNLSNIVPQIAAPLLATLILTMPGANIHWVFAAGGIVAALGAGMVTAMRSVD